MTKSGIDTRSKILEAAYRLFYRKGYSRVGVDEIAEGAGVTKRTLYYHFDSKDAVLAAMLEHQHLLATRDMQNWPALKAKTATAYIQQLFAATARWSARPDFFGTGFSRIVMELADLKGHPARAIAKRHKTAIETVHAEVLRGYGVAEPEVRARDLSTLLEGAVVLSLVHGGRSYIDAAERAALKLIVG